MVCRSLRGSWEPFRGTVCLNHWNNDRHYLDFPSGSNGKKSAWDVGDLGLIPGSGRPSGGGLGNPSTIARRIPMDRGAWQAAVHGLQRVGCNWAAKHESCLHLSGNGGGGANSTYPAAFAIETRKASFVCWSSKNVLDRADFILST